MSIDEIAGKVVEFVTSLCAAQRALKRSRRNSATVKRFKHGRNYRSRVPAKRGTKCDSIR